MVYTDRQLRNIVIFAAVAACVAVVISVAALISALCMHHGHRGAPVSVPSITAR